MADEGQVMGTSRPPRPASSRAIDRLTDTLGDERVFVAAAVLVVPVALVGAATGTLTTIASIVALLTLVMVFAVQHTSSRESRALNLKLDELIRATDARNELIGAEGESHEHLNRRRRDLLEERERLERDA
jgi:low affinity Fe/Cu permease